jgi:hypothetical protein
MASRVNGFGLLALGVVCSEERVDRVFARSLFTAAHGNVRIFFHPQTLDEDESNYAAAARALYFPARGYKLS